MSIESASTRGPCRVHSICRQSSACRLTVSLTVESQLRSADVFKMFEKRSTSYCDLNSNSRFKGERILIELLIDSFYELS